MRIPMVEGRSSRAVGGIHRLAFNSADQHSVLENGPIGANTWNDRILSGDNLPFGSQPNVEPESQAEERSLDL